MNIEKEEKLENAENIYSQSQSPSQSNSKSKSIKSDSNKKKSITTENYYTNPGQGMINVNKTKKEYENKIRIILNRLHRLKLVEDTAIKKLNNLKQRMARDEKSRQYKTIIKEEIEQARNEITVQSKALHDKLSKKKVKEKRNSVIKKSVIELEHKSNYSQSVREKQVIDELMKQVKQQELDLKSHNYLKIKEDRLKKRQSREKKKNDEEKEKKNYYNQKLDKSIQESKFLEEQLNYLEELESKALELTSKTISKNKASVESFHKNLKLNSSRCESKTKNEIIKEGNNADDLVNNDKEKEVRNLEAENNKESIDNKNYKENIDAVESKILNTNYNTTTNFHTAHTPSQSLEEQFNFLSPIKTLDIIVKEKEREKKEKKEVVKEDFTSNKEEKLVRIDITKPKDSTKPNSTMSSFKDIFKGKHTTGNFSESDFSYIKSLNQSLLTLSKPTTAREKNSMKNGKENEVKATTNKKTIDSSLNNLNNHPTKSRVLASYYKEKSKIDALNKTKKNTSQTKINKVSFNQKIGKAEEGNSRSKNKESKKQSLRSQNSSTGNNNNQKMNNRKSSAPQFSKGKTIQNNPTNTKKSILRTTSSVARGSQPTPMTMSSSNQQQQKKMMANNTLIKKSVTTKVQPSLTGGHRSSSITQEIRDKYKIK